MKKPTDKELKVVVNTLAERMRNVIFMNAEDKAREAIHSIPWEEVNSEWLIEVEYVVKFTVNDILEIVGGIRRKKRKEGI